MPFDDALGISHQAVPPVGCCARDTPTLRRSSDVRRRAPPGGTATVPEATAA